MFVVAHCCAHVHRLPLLLPLLVDRCLFTPPTDLASAKLHLPPSSQTCHRAFHPCHHHCHCVAIVPSIGVTSPSRHPSPSPPRHPSPSSPSHRRCAVHRRCSCAIHHRRSLLIAVKPSVAIALPLPCHCVAVAPSIATAIAVAPSITVVAVLLSSRLPSPSPLRRPSLSPSQCDVLISAKQKNLFEWGAQLKKNE